MEATTIRSLWRHTGARVARGMLTAATLFGLAAAAQALTITVQSTDPAKPFTGGFRYTIEEDGTLDVVAAVTDPVAGYAVDASAKIVFLTCPD